MLNNKANGLLLSNQTIRIVDKERGNLPRSRYTPRTYEIKENLKDALTGSSRDSITQEPPNLSICDAADCNNEATQNIQVRAGKFAMISLSVCSKCVKKFED